MCTIKITNANGNRQPAASGPLKPKQLVRLKDSEDQGKMGHGSNGLRESGLSLSDSQY